MRIGVVGSMQYAEKLEEIRDKLRVMGHDAFMNAMYETFIGKSVEERQKVDVEQKSHGDVIREFWRKMQGADAIVVCNFDKRGIQHYIGGNTLMEIGFAHVLDQKIFLLNPIPEIPYYKTEIEAVKPIILNGDLSKVK